MTKMTLKTQYSSVTYFKYFDNLYHNIKYQNEINMQ